MTTKTKTKTSSALLDPDRIELRPGMSAAEIFDAYGLTCPPRIGTLRDPSRKTFGCAVAKVARKLGQPLMPWQRYAADVALEVDSLTDELVYRDVTLLVPRQSGKTTLILAVKAHRALAMGRIAKKFNPSQGARQRIRYAAQSRNQAREKFVEDHLPVLQASAYAGRFQARLASGSECIIWDTGAYDGITSNTETAGHGPTLDLGIEDEFWAAEDTRLEQAFSPAMITRWSPQHWRVSTEGTEKSTYLASKVTLGREIVESGLAGSVCYLEWSNLDGPMDQPSTWLTCMPAMCPTPGSCRCSPSWRHTVTVKAIHGELAKMASDPEDFERAFLNRRRGSKPKPDPNVPAYLLWSNLVDPEPLVPGDPLAFGIELLLDRSAAAIVAVWLGADGKYRIKVIEYNPGIAWVVPRAASLNERWKPVAWGMGLAGPCASLVQPLAGIKIIRPASEAVAQRGQLYVPTGQEYAGACGAVADRVRNGTILHEDQHSLNEAWKAARSKVNGDSWTWHRRAAAADLSTLVAGTVGLAALERRKHLPRADAYSAVNNIW